MNKSEFIKELSRQTSYSEERCNTINNIVEDTFIIGKRNKEKMIEKFKKQTNLDENEANKLYETVMRIIGNEIKNKIYEFINKNRL